MNIDLPAWRSTVATTSNPLPDHLAVSPEEETAQNQNIHLAEIIGGGAAFLEILRLINKWRRVRKLHRLGQEVKTKAAAIGLEEPRGLTKLPFNHFHIPEKHLNLLGNKKELAFVGLPLMLLLWVLFQWLIHRAHARKLQRQQAAAATTLATETHAPAAQQPAQPAAAQAAAPAHGNDHNDGHDDGHGGHVGGHAGTNPFVVLLAIIGAIFFGGLAVHWFMTANYPDAMRVSPAFAPQAQTTAQSAPAATPQEAPATPVVVPAPKVSGTTVSCTEETPCTTMTDGPNNPLKIEVPVGYNLRTDVPDSSNVEEACLINGQKTIGESNSTICDGTREVQLASMLKDLYDQSLRAAVTYWFVKA